MGATVAENAEEFMEIEQGEEIYNAYMDAFPGLKKYFAICKKEGLKNGFILISELTGRKSFIYGYEEYLELNKKIDRKFWDRWRWLKLRGKDSEEYIRVKGEISRYFKLKGEIERKSLNFPTQGIAAEISKIAGILLFNWILDNNHQNIVLIANDVHDEYVLDVPEELAKMAKEALHSCMLLSGKEYCKRIPLLADVKIAEDWGQK